MVPVLWAQASWAQQPAASTEPNDFKAGIKSVSYESPGTAHEWLTWRRHLREFAALLFKE
jgi:enterochelin esterase-like enzyme